MMLFVSDYLDLYVSDDIYVGTTLDAQACLDAAYNASTDIAGFTFDREVGGCWYCLSITTYELRAPDEQLEFWMRIDLHMKVSALTSCLTEQDARYLLMQKVYRDQQTCPVPVGYRFRAMLIVKPGVYL